MKRIFVLSFLLFGTNLLCGENCPSWRGPRGDGTSTEKDLPTTWSPKENVRWKLKLPGPGNSSPIIWGDRIFLTQSIDKQGTERGLMCIDRQSGKLIWQKTVPFKEKEPTHGTNPYCAATPVTDGERVIVSHGSAGVYCYDFDGKELWHRDLGKFIHIWGTAASPILYQDLVILNCGPGENTFLLAMNKKTGEDVWKAPEPKGASGLDEGEKKGEWIGSWSTPLLQLKEKDQLLMSWPEVLKAYDPKTGEVLWSCKGLTKLVYTSPVANSDVVVAMSGYHGSAIAVKTRGKGDVTTTHRLWHHSKRNPQRIGSGIIVGDHLYMVNAENGIAQCFELPSGKNLWEGKDRLGVAHWGSLVLADGIFYATDQDGNTFLFEAKPELKVIRKNSLGEHVNASLAISDGEIFIRSYQHLWCISNSK
jgi:outer membrane protein assembly factor BamB